MVYCLIFFFIRKIVIKLFCHSGYIFSSNTQLKWCPNVCKTPVLMLLSAKLYKIRI